MKFSIIIPTYNREKTIERAVKSVVSQSYSDWELILIDDVSTDETMQSARNMREYYEIPHERFKIVRNEKRSERVVSRNHGMRLVTGDYVCWLDSDDEYVSWYLELLRDVFNRLGLYDLVNFGSMIIHRDGAGSIVGETHRDAVPFKQGQEFKSGTINTGSFVYSYGAMQEVGFLPEASQPYGYSDSFSAVCKNPNYGQNENGQWLPLGNPWGDDYQYFYMLTRKFKPMMVDYSLYVQHAR